MAEDKAAKAAYMKAYREANREAVLARQKAYREANREAVLARQKACYEANREAARARQKAWCEALAPSYVAARVGLPLAECPPELIAMKTEQLRLHRAGRALKAAIKEGA